MEFWLLVVIGILLIIIFLWLLNYFSYTKLYEK